jgi:transcriptional regulator with GAF, ATPase, and Fis domain
MAISPDQSVLTLIQALRGVLAQVAEPIQVLRTILGQAVQRTEADRGVFVEVHRSGNLDFRVLHRFDLVELAGGAESFSRAIFAEVLRSGEPLLIENAMDDPRFVGSESVQELRLVSVLCMPVRVGERIGALVHLERERTGHFTPAHRDLLRGLLEVAAPILETLRVGSKVLAERDQLRETAEQFEKELAENREVLSRDWSFGRFVGRSPQVRDLEESVRRAAATDLPVLIEGETGTGKSLLARVMHHAGPRSKRAFVTLFCPSLEAGMVETELFGHRRGAFTGADSDRIGKVQAAERGTLFLDEVGELPTAIQPKLLRLLHEKAYERVGDPQERTADVRIVAATHKDLGAEVRAGRFRLDLYERLRFVVLRIPPLRERRSDIPMLLRHALDRYDAGRWIEISEAAAAFLAASDYPWSGNVREVEQLAARLLLEAKREPITPADLEAHLRHPETLAAPPTYSPGSAGASAAAFPAMMEDAERAILEQALRANPGLSRAELAAKLQISERALYKKLRLFDLGG